MESVKHAWEPRPLSFRATKVAADVVYYVPRSVTCLDATSEMANSNADPAEHRPVVSVPDRACLTRCDRDRAALCAVEGSKEDPGQDVHTHGYGVRGHAGAADDHSAPAVLCKNAGRLRDRHPRDALWNWDHFRSNRRLFHPRTTVERAD